jgi:cell division protein ZapE
MSLLTRFPVSNVADLLSELTPPREFTNARFENYFEDANFPTQLAAKTKLEGFASSGKSGKLPGVYLDGGFGVGKTHLLASTFFAFKGKRKAFGSFIAFTALIGALGFANALRELKSYQFIAIDEFELDDPGNTMIMSRLLNELAARGTRFAATSNTPPNALGEGRFAADDFQREILGIGRQFLMVRVDGEDYRHRPTKAAEVTYAQEELQEWIDTETAVADFDQLLKKLGTVHPALYGKLLTGDRKVALSNVFLLTDQNDALRFVSFVDRAYEFQIAIHGSGVPLTNIFPKHFLDGGYRKKYLRAVSRLGALSS